MAVSQVSEPRKVLAGLLKDNAEYINGESTPQSELSSAAVRQDLAENGQKPVVAIVACADSRVGPEIIFGAGIGKLFVIRNAGNVVSETSVLASLEYAVVHLKVSLVMVLGHSKCGAVTAAVNAAKAPAGDDENAPPPTSLVEYVTGLAEVLKEDVGKPDEINVCISSNICKGVKALKFDPSPIADAYADGSVDIVGAVYDISTGLVSVVDE